MIIRTLTDVSSDDLYAAFSSAFTDYDIQFSRNQLQALLKRRGFNPGLSLAAFEDERIVSFCFNGTGTFEGIPTAYDTGTGTLKEYRGKGIAAGIFRQSLPLLRDAGIRQYLLEVMFHNTSAINLYRKAGFKVSRELKYYIQESHMVSVTRPLSASGCQVHRIALNAALAAAGFNDFQPSWQNSPEALMRNPSDFVAFGAFIDGLQVGYCIIEPESGDIPGIAVDRNYRRKGIGSALLAEVLKSNRCEKIRIINTDTTSQSISLFLESVNIPLSGLQYEMKMII